MRRSGRLMDRMFRIPLSLDFVNDLACLYFFVALACFPDFVENVAPDNKCLTTQRIFLRLSPERGREENRRERITFAREDWLTEARAVKFR